MDSTVKRPDKLATILEDEHNPVHKNPDDTHKRSSPEKTTGMSTVSTTVQRPASGTSLETALSISSGEDSDSNSRITPTQTFIQECNRRGPPQRMSSFGSSGRDEFRSKFVTTPTRAMNRNQLLRIQRDAEEQRQSQSTSLVIPRDATEARILDQTSGTSAWADATQAEFTAVTRTKTLEHIIDWKENSTLTDDDPGTFTDVPLNDDDADIPGLLESTAPADSAPFLPVTGKNTYDPNHHTTYASNRARGTPASRQRRRKGSRTPSKSKSQDNSTTSSAKKPSEQSRMSSICAILSPSIHQSDSDDASYQPSDASNEDLNQKPSAQPKRKSHDQDDSDFQKPKQA